MKGDIAGMTVLSYIVFNYNTLDNRHIMNSPYIENG